MKRYIVIYCFTVLFLVAAIISTLTSTSANALQLQITDPADNKVYDITQQNHTITISANGTVKSISFSDEIIGAICFDSAFTFLAVRNDAQNISRYVFMSYNATNGNIVTLATDIIVNKNAVSFCGDESGNFYLLDSTDNRTIHILSQKSKSRINTDNTVYQMLYVGNNELLVFTDCETGCITNGSYRSLSSLCPATPCTYYGENTVVDAQGTEYLYENSKFEKITPPTENNDTSPIPSGTQYITSINETHITITQGTTFAKLYKELGLNKCDLTVCKPDGKIIDSGILGTGMTAKFNGKSLQIIVMGDVTGEGNINSRDLKAVMKHLSGESMLQGDYLRAADLYSDKIINTKDLVKLSNLY